MKLEYNEMFKDDCEDLMETICDNYSVYDGISLDDYTSEVFSYIKDHLSMYHRSYQERLERD